MKPVIYLFLLSNLFDSCSNEKNSLICNDFKSGVFESINQKTNLKFVIKREENSQDEYATNLKTNEVVVANKTSKIKWINDCDYVLFVDTNKNKTNEHEHYINSKGGLKNKILKIENNCATVETTFESNKLVLKYCKVK